MSDEFKEIANGAARRVVDTCGAVDDVMTRERVARVILAAIREAVAMANEWERLNDRRCTLIHKEVYSQLDENETQELQDLQALADLRIGNVYRIEELEKEKETLKSRCDKAMKVQRDKIEELEQKGQDLCNQNGGLLIEQHDLKRDLAEAQEAMGAAANCISLSRPHEAAVILRKTQGN